MSAESKVSLLKKENQRLKAQHERMLKIINLSGALTSTHHIDVILDAVLEKTQEICEAEASSLWMVDEDRGDIYLYMTGEQNEFAKVLQTTRLKKGQGICGWVVQKNKPVLVADCQSDSRFQGEIDKKTKFISRTMICVPLVVREHVIGALQILNKKENKTFDQTDLTITTILGHQIAIAVQNARLNHSVTVDADTNLYRRAYFREVLNAEFKIAKKKMHNLAVLMCDIDHFKKVNDTYGHQSGDIAILHLSNILHQTLHKLGSRDIAGRYGGEEFCALLIGYSLETVKDIAENLRIQIEQSQIPLNNGKTIQITASIGIAHFPVHQEYLTSADDFIALADEALFLCKSKGRNCISSFNAQQTKVLK